MLNRFNSLRTWAHIISTFFRPLLLYISLDFARKIPEPRCAFPGLKESWYTIFLSSRYTPARIQWFRPLLMGMKKTLKLKISTFPTYAYHFSHSIMIHPLTLIGAFIQLHELITECNISKEVLTISIPRALSHYMRDCCCSAVNNLIVNTTKAILCNLVPLPKLP